MENILEQLIIPLKEIYKDIDELEKSKIQISNFHKKSEEYLPLLFGTYSFIYSVLIYLI